MSETYKPEQGPTIESSEGLNPFEDWTRETIVDQQAAFHARILELQNESLDPTTPADQKEQNATDIKILQDEIDLMEEALRAKPESAEKNILDLSGLSQDESDARELSA